MRSIGVEPGYHSNIFSLLGWGGGRGGDGRGSWGAVVISEEELLDISRRIRFWRFVGLSSTPPSSVEDCVPAQLLSSAAPSSSTKSLQPAASPSFSSVAFNLFLGLLLLDFAALSYNCLVSTTSRTSRWPVSSSTVTTYLGVRRLRKPARSGKIDHANRASRNSGRQCGIGWSWIL
jgi:hypothetical protein